MDASEIYSKRLNAKEVIFPKEKGEFIFPIADGRIKTLGGDQDLRTSTLVRHRPIQEECQGDFLGESEKSPPSPPQDSFPDAGEAINDFWSMSETSCYCCLRNIQDLLADGETPYARRLGEPFKGPIIPFGAMVEYHPISTRDSSIQFGKKVLPCIFLRCELIAVAEFGKKKFKLRIWKIWKSWTHQKFVLKESTRKKY